ncbi:MAG TPA: type II and III secretion system protein [Bryobacteraceae bacterium]|nr:type II and III secretion system protein [Bryobacteraceae bacterium]
MSLFRVAIGLWLAVLLHATGPASKLYSEGRAAEREGRYGAAYLLYSRAYALEPEKAEYRARAESVRRQGILQLEVDSSGGLAGGIEPAGVEALEPADVPGEAELRPPPVLVGAASLQSFKLEGDVKVLWQKVLDPYGLEAVFDAYLTPGKPLKFELAQADWRTAVRALETMTGTFIVPLGDRLGIVVKDTVQKRSEMERHMTASVPFPMTLAPQELQEAAQAVRTVFDIQKFGIDTAHGVVVLKDRASRVKPAIKLFKQLTEHRAQVMLEIELVNLGENSSLRLGMTLPTSFPIVNLSSAWNNTVSIPSSISRMLTFGSGKWMLGLGLSGAELFASLTEGESRVLARSQILTVNGQAATLHVGDKYPMQTQIYSSGTTSDGDTYTPTPTIQFEDLGVSLKATPYIHGEEELTLDVEAEFKLLAGSALNGIPVISNRKLQSRVRMKFGETAVVAGLSGASDSKGLSGLPGLAAIGPLRSNTREKDKSELLLTIRPRLTGLPPSGSVPSVIWAGTETRPLTPLD